MNNATNTTASDLDIVIALEETTLSSFSDEYRALKAAATAAAARIAAAELTNRVRAAFLAVAGSFNRYVDLKDLRAALVGEDRAAVDAALLGLQSAGVAVLYPTDNVQQLRQADHDAALYVCGCRRDVVCITR